MKHTEAIWTWFIRNAQRNGTYGYSYLDSDIRDHLLSCGIAEGSDMPEFGTVTTWNGTFDPNARIGAIYSDRWVCNCGAYGSGNRLSGRGRTDSLELAVIGDHSLSEVILAVIAIGDEAEAAVDNEFDY